MRGKCLCGEIEFELTGSIPMLYQCHCSLCRKQSGSASNSATVVQPHQLRWDSGQDLVRSYRKSTGFRSDFCSRCGSPVPNPIGDTPYLWIPAGLLEDGDQLVIAAHIFVGSKASWDPIGNARVQFHEMPPLDDFMRLLHYGTGLSDI